MCLSRNTPKMARFREFPFDDLPKRVRAKKRRPLFPRGSFPGFGVGKVRAPPSRKPPKKATLSENLPSQTIKSKTGGLRRGEGAVWSSMPPGLAIYVSPPRTYCMPLRRQLFLCFREGFFRRKPNPSPARFCQPRAPPPGSGWAGGRRRGAATRTATAPRRRSGYYPWLEGHVQWPQRLRTKRKPPRTFSTEVGFCFVFFLWVIFCWLAWMSSCGGGGTLKAPKPKARPPNKDAGNFSNLFGLGEGFGPG